ncbi:MAG: hypothetical protein AB8H12_19095 [Lewinella sp.]
MRYFLFLTLFVLSACAGDTVETSTEVPTTDSPSSERPVQTTAPSAPLRAGEILAFPSEQIEECNCSLHLFPVPEGGSEKDLFFVFNRKSSGPGVIGLNGQEYVVERGASLGTGGNKKYTSYLHQNGFISIQTSLTELSTTDGEGGQYSGRVKVKNLETGEELVVGVAGTCTC